MDEETRKNLRGEAKVVAVVFGCLFAWLLASAIPHGRQYLGYVAILIVMWWLRETIAFLVQTAYIEARQFFNAPLSRRSTPEGRSSSPSPGPGNDQ